AVGGVHLGPGAGLQRLAGGLDGLVDVGGGGVRDLGEDLSGGGVVGVEGLAVGGLDPSVVDEQARFLDRGSGGTLFRRCGFRHGMVLSERPGAAWLDKRGVRSVDRYGGGIIAGAGAKAIISLGARTG